MAADKSGDMAINMPETNKGKAVAVIGQPKRGVKKGIAVGDFILRLCAIGATLGDAVSMGTADQLLPFTTQFFQFEAEYDDFDAFRFFVISIAIASGYLLISLPFSIICIIRPLAIAPRLTLVIFDAVIAGVTIAAGSAAAAIVYLAHNGNPSTNWLPICQQFGDFCQSASGAVIGSLVAGALLFLLVIFAAFALKRS